MKTLLFIGLCLAVLLITIIFETAQDYWMSKDSENLYKKKWKFWGNAQIWAYLVLLTTLDILLTDLYSLLLFPILGFIFWISHDAGLGVRFKKGIYYLSDEGFDGKFKAVCIGSGGVAFWVRIIWLSLTIAAYLSL
jgi:hypothetical protein